MTPRAMLALARVAHIPLDVVLSWPVSRIAFWLAETAAALEDEKRRGDP